MAPFFRTRLRRLLPPEANAIIEDAKSMQRFKDILEVTAPRMSPDWLDVDKEAYKGTVKEFPSREAIDVPVNETLIVELYSK